MNELPNTDAARLIRELGGWLEPTDWTHFATLTPHWDRPSPAALGRAFLRWLHSIERKAAGPVPWFRAIERGRNGLLHIHALIAVPSPLPIAALRQPWRAGHSKIARYDRQRGARYYLAKAVANPASDWDFSFT